MWPACSLFTKCDFYLCIMTVPIPVTLGAGLIWEKKRGRYGGNARAGWNAQPSILPLSLLPYLTHWEAQPCLGPVTSLGLGLSHGVLKSGP